MNITKTLQQYAETLKELEAYAKAHERDMGNPQEVVKLHQETSAALYKLVRTAPCEDTEEIEDLRKQVKELKAALRRRDKKELVSPEAGALPMTKNPDCTYIEGVAYQVRSLSYRIEHEEYPLVTIKVFKDDTSAAKFIGEGGHNGCGKPMRLGACIVECEVPVVPEVRLGSTR